MANGRKVRADLMRFPRDQLEFQKSVFLPEFNRPILGADIGRIRELFFRNRHLIGVFVFRKISFHLTRLIYDAMADGLIELSDRSLADQVR